MFTVLFIVDTLADEVSNHIATEVCLAAKCVRVSR